MVIDDFVSNDECDALIAATDGHMQVGTTTLCISVLILCSTARLSQLLRALPAAVSCLECTS
jgi:hypothetical protein